MQHQRYWLSVIDSINLRENWLKFLGIWGEAELILGILGAKEKYFQGAEVLSIRELGRLMHYFRDQGSTDPPGGPYWWKPQKWRETQFNFYVGTQLF